MNNGHLKNSITYLFLALFLSMKMAGLHVLSHTNDKDHAVHCTLCDHAIAHNLTPAILSDIQGIVVKNMEPVPLLEKTGFYDFLNCGALAQNQLFSRPPPLVL